MAHLKPARALWTSLGLPLSEAQTLKLSPRPDLVVNSSFKVGEAAQTSIGLSAQSAAYFHKLRAGVEQEVSVDARHAAIEFHSEVYYTLYDKPPPALWDAIAGLYSTADGHVRIHTNFSHHRRGILEILEIPDHPSVTRSDVQTRLARWKAVEFETEAAKRGMCATALRTFAEWDAHPQAEALKEVPPVQLIKIGEAPKREVGAGVKPRYALEGMRVLDLTRVIAGPVAGRTLAAHGADVLLVTSPNLPDLPALDVDTSRGKRTTQLDLNKDADKRTLTELASTCDVFLQSYRPGALAAKGFGPADLAKTRPGVVYASLCAWGWEGPWKDRRGFDSLVQTATGFNAAEGEAYAAAHEGEDWKPRPLPVQALDHAAGYLLAFGINAALCKTITEGGSWEVRVSLAGVGQWIRSLGRLSPEDAFLHATPLPPPSLPHAPEIQELSGVWHDPAGQPVLKAIKHSAVMEKTPVKQGRAPIKLNIDAPRWNA
ncbi:CoA-transferase family III [Schizophyllum commune H4-8]|nr:CoA-transferase family III [Schizophyllum commune H4-8]KAI5896392.1 CoA-transferase family III [Schizophyllum commune H4-8]